MISSQSNGNSPVISPAATGNLATDAAEGHPVIASAQQDTGEARYCAPDQQFMRLASELTQVLSLQSDVSSAYLTEAHPQTGIGLMNLVLVVKSDTKRRSLFDILKRTMRSALSPEQPFDVVHIDDAPKAVVFRLAEVTLPFYAKTLDRRRRRVRDSGEPLDFTQHFTTDLDIETSYASLGRFQFTTF